MRACACALVQTRCYERPGQNRGPVLLECLSDSLHPSWSRLEMNDSGQERGWQVWICGFCCCFNLFRLWEGPLVKRPRFRAEHGFKVAPEKIGPIDEFMICHQTAPLWFCSFQPD